MDQIRQIELENMKTDIPEFNAGDTVDVHYLIREGDKERIQVFSGTVIAIKGTGVRRTALVHQIPYYTTVSGARAAIQAIAALQNGSLDVAPLQSYFMSR